MSVLPLTNDEKIALLNLLAVDGVGSSAAIRLVEAFGAPSSVFSASESMLRAIPRLTASAIANIRQAKSDDIYGREQMERAQKESVEIRSYWDENYPFELKQLDTDAPAVLYIRGTLPPIAKRIAVVGTRHATQYGERATKELMSGLKGTDITVVSGLAAGIDGFAHAAALDAGLRTEAVFGCGIDIIFPANHKTLARRIAESNGALLTEYPFGFPADVGTFPARNRIIAGLSRVSLVIEAPMRSGALITARLAIEYNRDVGAVPGAMYNENSRGCHDLIKTGAALIESPADILALMKMQPDKAKPSRVIQIPLDLPQIEAEIIRMLDVTEAVHIDSIAERAGISAGEALSRSLMLELKGLIRQLPGKYFVRA